jgi:glycolate oxidase iron-sulfur subunit
LASSSPETSSIPAAAASTAGIGLDPRTYERALSCVHCGLCLPACPTYVETGQESDSPRGRIQLMRALADGAIEPSASVRKHLDLCLDCRGCETACPSGVVYHELIEETRAKLAATETLTGSARFMQWMFFNVMTHPRRLKLALLPARLMQKVGVWKLLEAIGIDRMLPGPVGKMVAMLPPTGPLWPATMAEHLPITGAGTRRKTVGFFAGCIGSVMFTRTNQQAGELLSACGAEVVVSRQQDCCGAIHHHNGRPHEAEAMAKRNIDAFAGVEMIVTCIAGCGAMLREYDVLLRDDAAYAEKAKDFVRRVRDVSEALIELGLPDMPNTVVETVTYHDACHLAHAQKVTAPPRQLLARINGLVIRPLPESDMCCGAAGTYNLQQPEMARKLADRKLANIASTDAAVCVTGNVGCAMQIASEARRRGQKLEVVHPVALLHRAMFGE